MDFLTDTIAAISTPVGQGGIGIVRLSGSNAIELADRLFIAKNGVSLSELPSYKLAYGKLQDPQTGGLIDEVIVTIMRAPHTYTREDVVEINCHAGTVVLKAALEAVLRTGARLAAPGEFTKRAYLNGRIDLAQAEAVSALVRSKSEMAAKVALRQLSGGLSEKVHSIRQELVTLLAQAEAAVDFSDEDIETPELSQIAGQIKSHKVEIEALLYTSRFGKILSNGLVTAIVGRPNVGKSSLLNILAEERRAIVTDTPGTTRDIVETTVSIDGVPVIFKDTAGIRDPRDEPEAAGVALSRQAAKESDLVLFVIDGSEALTGEDLIIVDQVRDQPVILVINKTDLPLNVDSKTVTSLMSFTSCVKTSAINNVGIENLRRSISSFAQNGDSVEADIIIANVRHEQALEKARDKLAQTLEAISDGYTEEVIAQTLKDAVDALGEIIGAISYEDLLDEIFSQFCIGK